MKNRAPFILLGLLIAVLVAITLYYGFFTDEQSLSKGEWQSRHSTVANTNLKLQLLARNIQALRGENRCDHDNQCRVVGLGARACGYFKDFLVYSINDIEEATLLRLVGEFNKLHEKLTDLSLTPNKCGDKLNPVKCISNYCAIVDPTEN